MPNLLQTLPFFLVALFRFCFRKVTWKSKFSEFFYLLKTQWWLLSWKRVNPLPDYYSSTRCNNSKFMKDFPIFLVALLRFCHRKSSLKFSNLTVFLPPKKTLVATFSEMHAPTSRNYVSEHGIIMINLLQTLQYFWLHSSLFASEN